jgi:C-terminal processing protease CtpA/Prc
MDILGLTLRLMTDGRYQVIGLVGKNGKPLVEGIKSGDILLQVGDLKTTGATMGAVVDAMRGTPGDKRILKLERDGQTFTVEARVERIL